MLPSLGIKAAIYALIAAAICTGLYALHSSIYESGRNAERIICQGNENKELADANAKYADLQTAYRAQELQHATDQAAIAERYQKEKADNDRKKDAVIAGLRAGSVVLRDYHNSLESGRSGPTQVAATAPGSDGQAGTKLSGPLSEFLVGEASRADDVVKQLAACQAVVMSDRGISIQEQRAVE